MPELWSTEQIRVYLGAKTIRSASRTLHRLGITPVSREPGRSGMNLYDAALVVEEIAKHPRLSARINEAGLKEKR